MIGQDVPATSEIQFMIQAGGLGLAAYLIWWLTKKLNGKFDRLAEAVESLDESIKELLEGVIGVDK
jgi:hypothetical protein